MDFSKLDAALAGALDPQPREPREWPEAMADPKLLVFVHVQPDDVDRRELTRLGVRAESITGNVATATLSPEQIDELSEQPWVRQIRLSQPLKLLGGRKGGPPKSVI